MCKTLYMYVCMCGTIWKSADSFIGPCVVAAATEVEEAAGAGTGARHMWAVIINALHINIFSIVKTDARSGGGGERGR